jgi:hypothetical protein
MERVWSVKSDRQNGIESIAFGISGILTKRMESGRRKDLLVNTTEKKDIDILQRWTFLSFSFKTVGGFVKMVLLLIQVYARYM